MKKPIFRSELTNQAILPISVTSTTFGKISSIKVLGYFKLNDADDVKEVDIFNSMDYQ